MTVCTTHISASFFVNATATTENYTDGHPLSQHDALPSFDPPPPVGQPPVRQRQGVQGAAQRLDQRQAVAHQRHIDPHHFVDGSRVDIEDRKSTRLTSSHSCASRMPSSA